MRLARRLARAAKLGLALQFFWWAVVAWADVLTR